MAIVGLDPSNNHVWIIAANSQVLPLGTGYNTVTGPTINGNTGPGQNSKYAACFTKLSNIPNHTFTLPYIAGCRVYISRGQQLYFYFFGATGAPSGYTAPNPQSPTDPNTGILYDDISSLKVDARYQVVLYESDNFTGGTLTLTLTTSNTCLVDNALGAGNWNDKTTSLRLQTATASFSRQLEAEAANVNNGMTVETCSDAGSG